MAYQLTAAASPSTVVSSSSASRAAWKPGATLPSVQVFESTTQSALTVWLPASVEVSVSAGAAFSSCELGVVAPSTPVLQEDVVRDLPAGGRFRRHGHGLVGRGRQLDASLAAVERVGRLERDRLGR